jgi:predicted O-methyltransferase YrrM
MVNWHFIANFITHYWSATRIDVLHSPFVFDLYNSCRARQKTPTALLPIELLRQEAKQNKTPITQEDFGALGHLQKKRTKSISYFASTHAKPSRLAHIIYRMVNKYQYHHCIELGTSLGFTSMCIAKGLPNQAKLITIEGAAQIAQIAQQHFAQSNTKQKTELRVGNFDNLLPETLTQLPTIDFAFIDGNHTYEATIDYFTLSAGDKVSTMSFVQNLPQYGNQTDACGPAAFLNSLANTITLAGQGMVGAMREGKNNQCLGEARLNVDTTPSATLAVTPVPAVTPVY